jgi:hypothetical protein
LSKITWKSLSFHKNYVLVWMYITNRYLCEWLNWLNNHKDS